MVDVETLSTSPQAVILTIAGVKFVRGEEPTRDVVTTFYRKIDKESCLRVGLTIDPSTEKWWESKPEAVRRECFEGERIPLKKALTDLCEWFKGSTYVWSNGSSFDIPILTTAMTRCNITPPWKFWNIRDCRTAIDFGGVQSREMPKADHNSLNDCFRQIIGVNKAIRNLRLTY